MGLVVEAARAVATAEGIKEATEAGAEDTGEGTADREGRRAAATAEAGTGTRATTIGRDGTAVLTTGGGGRALARAGAGATTGRGPGAAGATTATATGTGTGTGLGGSAAKYS